MILNSRFVRIFSLIKKEFLSIFKDPKNRALIILPPVLQLCIFAQALTLEVKNINLSVLDYSNTFYSRELISYFQNSNWFNKIVFVKNKIQLKENIDLKNSQAGIIIQNDFAKEVYSQKPTSILLLLDGRQTNSASIIASYVASIVNNFNVDLNKKFNINNATINVVIRNWYNPNIEYKWFLTVSLIVMLALVLSLVLSALSIAREKEMETFNQLLVSPLTNDEILIGKVIPPLFIAFISSIVITMIVAFGFKVPFGGSIILYLFSTFIALFSIIGIGLFISSVSNTQQQAMLGVFAFQMPAVLLSGFVSPVEDMSFLFRVISFFNPLRYYMLINKGIYFKNMDFQTVFLNLIPLILIGFLTLFIARWSFINNKG